MENNVVVKYKGEIIGYCDANQKLSIKNKELWDRIFDNNSQLIYISSRGKGIIEPSGKVVKQEITSYDIESLTADDTFSKEKNDRQWNRYFEKDSEVVLDEVWMDGYEKKQFVNLIGKTGIILECNCDLHCIYGGFYQHIIKWEDGEITGKFLDKLSPISSIIKYKNDNI